MPLDRRQRLIKIREDVFHVLDADRDPHHTIGDADFAAAFFADGSVRHGGGMRYQGFDSAQGLGQRTHAHLAEHLVGVRERSGFEGDHGSEARHLALGQFVLRMIGQPGIENLLHFFVFREIVRDFAAAAVVLFHANGQSLDAAQDQPALEGRKDGAGGFLKKSEPFRLLGFGADHDTSQSVAVSVEEFRGGVDHHVGAEFDRALEIRRHESVVGDDFDAVPVAEFADGTEVAELHQRVGRRLQKHQPGVLLDCAFNVVDVGCIDVGECESKVCEDVIEQARRPAVEIMAGDNVVAGFEHRSDGVDRRHATGEHARCRSAFERREVGLQPVAGRIRYARIFITFVFANFFLDVGRSRVDWDSDGPATGAVTVPIYATSTYVQEEIGKHKGYEYSRVSNPTRDRLETNLAALEGGTASRVFASGMAAINAIATMLKAGDHVVAGHNLYGGTPRLFNHVLANFGLTFTYVDTSDVNNVERAIQKNTRLVFLETPTNPLMQLCDLRAIAELRNRHGVEVVADNTFMSPYFQRPIELGADMVVHSTTKFLNGHSDGLGGVVVCTKREQAEKLAFLQKCAGAILSPFECWLILRGVKTLAVRMLQHDCNGRKVADYLSKHKKVRKVFYPGPVSYTH